MGSWQDSLARLDQITRRLRRECPWDREQDARSIVPHTVEEAYELADAAERGESERMVDELGDVLFQVLFLSLLLEEQGEGDLAAVAECCSAKLIRRHPHVFGDQTSGGDSSASRPGSPEVETPAQVLAQWDRIKREQEGRGSEDPFADVPENLPALLYARKIQRRADPGGGSASVAESVDRDAAEKWVGDLLFSTVALSRRLGVDPELSLRAAARRATEG